MHVLNACKPVLDCLQTFELHHGRMAEVPSNLCQVQQNTLQHGSMSITQWVYVTFM